MYYDRIELITFNYPDEYDAERNWLKYGKSAGYRLIECDTSHAMYEKYVHYKMAPELKNVAKNENEPHVMAYTLKEIGGF